jgi:Transglycosylase SLT domain
MKKIVKILLVAMLSIPATGLKAERLHGEAAQVSSLCTTHFTRAETRYGIPKHLLLAIANTESGRYNHGLKRVLPWPWTLNIAGSGSYYGNMHDAVTAVNRAKQSGTTSIDVGCMQVNLKHHPRAFTSVQDALTPSRNIDYAAKFLRSNFDELGSWPKAIAAYHSRSRKGQNYFALVQKRWRDVRGIAGGSLLEDSGYVAAKSELINGVKVSRFLRDAQPRRELIKPPSQFMISMSDSSNKTSDKKVKVTIGGNSSNLSRKNNSSMKVIKVSEAVARKDNTTVTVTPTSQRLIAENETFKPKNWNNKNPNIRHQPNFIFGR